MQSPVTPAVARRNHPQRKGTPSVSGWSHPVIPADPAAADIGLWGPRQVEQGIDALAVAPGTAQHERRLRHHLDPSSVGSSGATDPEGPGPLSSRYDTEVHELAEQRAKLTARAAWWARCIQRDTASVATVARRLGVDWHTLWTAIKPSLAALIDDPTRLDGVLAFGFDEHIRHHAPRQGPRVPWRTAANRPPVPTAHDDPPPR